MGWKKESGVSEISWRRPDHPKFSYK